ncbi:MAG: hypothetical protein HQK51_10150 [Oligoflexia bacterium]|nr:hypothetical protein [Oligoflexia bacterium]
MGKFYFYILLLLIATVFLHGSVKSEDTISDEQRRILDEKQAELADRLAKAEKINTLYGRYKLIRDTYYLGDKGIKLEAEKLNEAKINWLKEWYVIIGLVEKSPTLTSISLRNDIHKRIKKQSDTLVTLSENIRANSYRANEALTTLNDLTRFTPGAMGSFSEIVSTMNTQIKLLEDAMKSWDSLYPDSQMNGNWQKLLDDTQSAIILKFKKAVLRYPELNQIIEQTEEMFRAEREFEPKISEIYLAFMKVQRNVNKKYTFTAEDSLNDLRKKAAEAISFVQSSNLDSIFKNKALEEINLHLANGEKSFKASLSFSARADIVARMFESEGNLLASQCRDNEKRKYVNCELFSFIYKTPKESILKMKNDELKFIEKKVLQINAGPEANIQEKK